VERSGARVMVFAPQVKVGTIRTVVTSYCCPSDFVIIDSRMTVASSWSSQECVEAAAP
jgi:hypothetical protein